jgi:isoprenylcysteine carboxyl methyltransferase (ICMT) family protein YpbQ
MFLCCIIEGRLVIVKIVDNSIHLSRLLFLFVDQQLLSFGKVGHMIKELETHNNHYVYMYSRRSFIQKSKYRKHPNNIIIEGWFGIVVLKATTTISNFLTTCAVVDCS